MAGRRLTFKIEGLDKLQKDLTKMIEKDLPKAVGDLHLKRAKRQLKQRIKYPQRSTGALHRSLKYTYKKNQYTISSRLVYAGPQDRGARIRVTQKMINYFWAMFKQTGDTMWRNMATTKKNVFIIPAKEYTYIPPKAYKRMLDRQVKKLIKKL